MVYINFTIYCILIIPLVPVTGGPAELRAGAIAGIVIAAVVLVVFVLLLIVIVVIVYYLRSRAKNQKSTHSVGDLQAELVMCTTI